MFKNYIYIFVCLFAGKVELKGKRIEVEHSVPKKQRYLSAFFCNLIPKSILMCCVPPALDFLIKFSCNVTVFVRWLVSSGVLMEIRAGAVRFGELFWGCAYWRECGETELCRPLLWKWAAACRAVSCRWGFPPAEAISLKPEHFQGTVSFTASYLLILHKKPLNLTGPVF